MENKPKFRPCLHPVIHIQCALQAFLFAEEHDVALYTRIVVDNGFKVCVEGGLQFRTGDAADGFCGIDKVKIGGKVFGENTCCLFIKLRGIVTLTAAFDCSEAMPSLDVL